MNLKKLIPLLLISLVFIAAKSDGGGWFSSSKSKSQDDSYNNSYSESAASSSNSYSQSSAAAPAGDDAEARANAISLLAKNPEALKSMINLAKALEASKGQTPEGSTTASQEKGWR